MIRGWELWGPKIDKKFETNTLNCIHKLVSPETNNLFQQYYHVLLGKGDTMTTSLAPAFIGTTEAMTAKNRVIYKRYK